MRTVKREEIMKRCLLLLLALAAANAPAVAQDWPNKPVKWILSQPADAYNYFWATTAALVSNPFTFKSLPYDPERDFVPVVLIGKSPMVVAVNNSVPAKSLAELIALDKSQPGKLAAANEGAKTFGGMMSQALNIV